MQRFFHRVGTALRETGQALDRTGLWLTERELFREPWSRHRQVMSLYEARPDIHGDAWAAPNASIIGDVTLSEGSSVWYGAVLRADRAPVNVGFKSNVQDRAVLTSLSQLESGFPSNTVIGNHCTIGHGAVLTSVTLREEVLVGMGAVLMEGVVVEKNAMVAAGAVIAPGTRVGEGQLWAGNPAQPVRDVTKEEIIFITDSAEEYHELALKHREEFLPYGTAHLDAERVAEETQARSQA